MLEVVPPPFRFDLKREVDLYEEVVRIYGYEKIKPQLALMQPLVLEDDPYVFVRELRNLLVTLGLKEVITYSITSEEKLASLGAKNPICLVNPLRSQENALRTTLLAGMLEASTYNLNQQNAPTAFFELGHIYGRNERPFSEKTSLGLITTQEGGAFYLKGMVSELFKSLALEQCEFTEVPSERYSSALAITSGKRSLGILGKLREDIAGQFDLKRDVYFAQLDIEELKNLKRQITYQPLNRYPVVYRDLSLALAPGKKFNDVEGILKEKALPYLSDWRVVDTYQGKNIAQGFVAFTLRVFYRGADRTLTSQEVDKLHHSLREELSQQDGIQLR